MLKRTALTAILCSTIAAPASVSQTTTPTLIRDPQALSLAAQSLRALTAGTTISDLTLQGTVSLSAGSDQESGTVTFVAKGTQESRLDVSLTGGSRTEVRNNTQQPSGYASVSGVVQHMAMHNCWTDESWLAPALGVLAKLPNDLQLSAVYVGSEVRNGTTVQHLRTYRVLTGQDQQFTASTANLSTEDIYLDASSLLPVSLVFSKKTDMDANVGVPVEIRFSSYSAMSGIMVPTRVQKLLDGGLFLDITLSSVQINTGVSDTLFANQ